MKLIAEDIALEIARLVFAKEHGETRLEMQLPFSIAAEADTWVVHGSPPVPLAHDFSKVEAPVEMRISQCTGQIFSNHFMISLPTPSETSPPTRS